MKILLIASYPTSIVNFRWDLIKRFIELGLEVHIAAPGFDEFKVESEFLEKKGCFIHNIVMHRTGTNPFIDLKTIFSLYKLIQRVSPDYVLSYTLKPVVYGSLAAYIARVPKCFSLITGLGYAFQDKKFFSVKFFLQLIIRYLYTYSLGKNSCIFFQNKDDEKLFKHLKILKPESYSVVVNGSGVNTSEYVTTPFPTYRDNCIVPHFLLIARLLGDKGVREYVEAAKIIKTKYPDILFDLVGWIDENPSAIKKKELDLWIKEGVINFLGKLSDVRPAIANCSIYVLPSYREGTPRTVLEAMAMGRPIITTDAPGCRETVIDGYNGFLVPVRSVGSLVEAMEKFIFNKTLIIEMGKASRLLAEEKYDVNKVNQVMLGEMGIV